MMTTPTAQESGLPRWNRARDTGLAAMLVWLLVWAVFAGWACLLTRWPGLTLEVALPGGTALVVGAGELLLAQQAALALGVGWNGMYAALCGWIDSLGSARPGQTPQSAQTSPPVNPVNPVNPTWAVLGLGLLNALLASGVLAVLSGHGSGFWGMPLPSSLALPVSLAVIVLAVTLCRAIIERRASCANLDAALAATPLLWLAWILPAGWFFSQFLAQSPVMPQAIIEWLAATTRSMAAIPVAVLAIRKISRRYSRPADTGDPACGSGQSLAARLPAELALGALLLFGSWNGMQQLIYTPLPHFLAAAGQMGQAGCALAALCAGFLFLKTSMRGHWSGASAAHTLTTLAGASLAVWGLAEVASLVPALTPVLQFSLWPLASSWLVHAGILVPSVILLCMPCPSPAQTCETRNAATQTAASPTFAARSPVNLVAARCLALGFMLATGAALLALVQHASALQHIRADWSTTLRPFELLATLAPAGLSLVALSAALMLKSRKTR